MGLKFHLLKSTALNRNGLTGFRLVRIALNLLYDRRGAALHEPPCPGILPHANASVS
jgi:hypothetical protein